MKIHPVYAELFHADRHYKANSRFFEILRKHLQTELKRKVFECRVDSSGSRQNSVTEDPVSTVISASIKRRYELGHLSN